MIFGRNFNKPSFGKDSFFGLSFFRDNLGKFLSNKI